MKNLNKVFLVVLLLGFTLVFSQKVTTQAIDKPSEGKALIYLINGATRKFDIYDNEKLVSSIKSGKYLTKEVEPGSHLFWTAQNPSNFLEATFSPNLTYVVAIEAQDSAVLLGVVGALTAGANMMVFDPKDYKHKKLFYQVIKNFKKSEIDLANENAQQNPEMIKKALEKYDKFKTEKEGRILVLTNDMNFQNADKPQK